MIEANWRNDGHIIHLELVKSEAQITSVSCPFPATKECQHDEVGCLVRYFLEIYGLECNVGVTEMAPDIPIAWTLLGKPSDLDSCQLWVIPTDDIMFQAWIRPS